MNIPQYATCSMCQSWEDDLCLSNFGTCKNAQEAAVEGLTQAGYPAPTSVKITLPWNAKPCPEWEASAEGQKDIDLHEAEERSIAKEEGRKRYDYHHHQRP